MGSGACRRAGRRREQNHAHTRCQGRSASNSKRVPDHLNSPFGVTLVGSDLYVANTDAIVRYPYKDGETKITEPGTKLTDLPGGPIDHHWTKSLLASPDGSKLYVGVGSNSNITENGMQAEVERASIWEVAAKKTMNESAAKKSAKTMAATRAKAPTGRTKVAKSATLKPTAKSATTKAPPKKLVAAVAKAPAGRAKVAHKPTAKPATTKKQIVAVPPTKRLAAPPKPVMPVAGAPKPFVLMPAAPIRTRGSREPILPRELESPCGEPSVPPSPTSADFSAQHATSRRACAAFGSNL